MSREFARDARISEVKEAICSVTGMPRDEQKLLWGSEELVDEDFLEMHQLPESVALTLLRPHPLVKLTKILTECTGKDFRSQLKRRDAISKIERIVEEQDVAVDTDYLKSLARAFFECSSDADHLSRCGLYLRILEVVAAQSGDMFVVDALVSYIQREIHTDSHRRLKNAAARCLCKVASPDTPFDFLRCLEEYTYDLEVRKFLSKMRTFTYKSPL